MSTAPPDPSAHADAFTAEDSLFAPPAPATAPTDLPPPDSPTDALVQEIVALRRQLLVVMLVLVIFFGSVNLFFLRQVSLIRQQSDKIQLMVVDYKTNQAPLMNELLAKLRGYAQTQPDFRPILERYFPTPPPPVPATRPAPPPPAKRAP